MNMTEKNITAGEAIKKLEERDGDANNESARTNELLAARAGDSDSDSIKESLKANDPSLSRSAYTSAKSGFNEDLDRDDVEAPKQARKGQTKTVNK
jgi:hypothetical protein